MKTALFVLLAFYGAGKATAGDPNAADGGGTMTVSPTSATAGSTGNSFLFTWGEATLKWNNGSAVTIDVPTGWT
ncbi:MAG: hypothetical protein WCK89_20360, partial [bacterium]